ncbi:MAG: ABC transporter ATP-binding protein, partial [Pseudomonadota bacterium]
LAAGGAAVIAISQDLDELMEVSDSLAVISGGSLSAPEPVANVSVEEIGLRMGGTHGMEVAHADA